MTNINTPLTPENWNSETPLTRLGIAFWPQILQELFGLLPEAIAHQQGDAWPTTLGALATKVGKDINEVVALLAEVLDEGRGIEVAPALVSSWMQDVHKSRLFIFDVRDRASFQSGSLPGAILLQDIDFNAMLPDLRTAEHIVCICAHGVRSVSAAMYLRRIGLEQAVSMQGGLEAFV